MKINFLFLLVLLSCNSISNDTCKRHKTIKNIEKCKNISMYEMYKLSSNKDCSCKVYTYGSDKNDTMNVLSAKLLLDTIIFKDTVAFFSFSYYDTLGKNAIYIAEIYKDCLPFYGIDVNLVTCAPVKAYFMESGEYEYNLRTESLNDSIFINCLNANIVACNGWLRNYVANVARKNDE